MLKKFVSFLIAISVIVVLFNTNTAKAQAADAATEYTSKKLGISFSVPAGYIVADADNHNALNVPMSNADLTRNTIMILDSSRKSYCEIYVDGAYCWNLEDLNENQRPDFIDQQRNLLYKKNLASLYTNKSGFQFYVFKDTFVARSVTAKNGMVFDFEFDDMYQSVSTIKAFMDTVSFVPFAKPYSDSVTSYTAPQFKLDIPPQYVAIDKSNINNNELTLTKWYYTVDGISQDFTDKSDYKLFIHNYFYDYTIWFYQTYSDITDLNTATQKERDRLKTQMVSFITSLKSTITSSDYVRDAQNKISYLQIKYYDKDANYIRYYFEKDNYQYEMICRDSDQKNDTDFSVIANSFVPLKVKQNSVGANSHRNMGLMLPAGGAFPILLLIFATGIVLALIILPIVLIVCLKPKRPSENGLTYDQTPPPYQESDTSGNFDPPYDYDEHNDPSDMPQDDSAPPTDTEDASSHDDYK